MATTRKNNREIAIEKAIQYAETRTINQKDFTDLIEFIYQFLTNKTKNNGRQQ